MTKLKIFGGVFIFVACSTRFHFYNTLHNLVSQENYNAAIQLVESKKEEEYGEKNAALYCMDVGALHQLAGNYEESNKFLHRAEQIVDDLYTKSIAAETLSLLTSDYAKPYEGEDFEKVMINLLSALNWAVSGDIDEALVEARKVDLKLEQYNSRYEKKNVYKEDAFIRYFMGLLHENEGTMEGINNAFISYIKALNSYKDYEVNYGTKTPPDLLLDALRTATIMGFDDEVERLYKEYPQLKELESKKRFNRDEGEVVFLHLLGVAPRKVDNFIQIAFGKGMIYARAQKPNTDEEADYNRAMNVAGAIAADVNIVIAFPSFQKQNFSVWGSKIILDSKSVESYLVEDVEAIAIKDLEDRKGRIFARTVARAVIKYSLAYLGGGAIGREVERRVGGILGKVLGWLFKKTAAAAAAATENADKRSWQTLPAKFKMARVSLPPGSYNLKIQLLSNYGEYLGEKILKNIKVEKGKRTFVFLRTAW